VCSQPCVSLSPIGTKFFDSGPELRSMIEVSQVAQLVDDHVVKDVKRREHQSPRERDGAGAATGAPARSAVSNPKRRRVRLGQVGDERRGNAASLLAVPPLNHAGCVFEVGRSNQDRIVGAYHARATGLAQRQGQRSAMAPDNVGALKTEVALLESSRLAGNPLAVRRDQFAACALAPAGGQDQFDTRSSLGDQTNSASACRSAHGHAHSINVENLHGHRIATAPDGAFEWPVPPGGWFEPLTTARRRANAGIVHT